MVDDMRAQLVEQPAMRPFGKIMIVHRPQHRAKAIGIDQVIATAIAIGRDIAQRLALADRDLAMEQPVGMHPFQRTDRLARQRLRLDSNGFGQQDASGKPALLRRMHAKRGEGIVILPLHQQIDLLARQHLSFHSGHADGHVGIFQMSVAYSRIVRSDENHPMRATLWIAFFAQTLWSSHSASTLRWAAE
eukprot:TRINITY_DN5369_c0_g1_i2.p1 TRINITY_DN5369_c0_g1~~TRINITY_DN5369_c0_g1_i2.p1  ORF type:complete len:190 (+),score=19.50 TRINITY_DN5369_c0_g1_i2:90-659(+)